MEYKLIGKRVKKARNEKGLTQERFAEELGVSVSFVSQVESGEKKFNLSRISEVSQILERPITYFVDGYEGKSADDLEEVVNLLKRMSDKQLKLALEIIRAMDAADSEL